MCCVSDMDVSELDQTQLSVCPAVGRVRETHVSVSDKEADEPRLQVNPVKACGERELPVGL